MGNVAKWEIEHIALVGDTKPSTYKVEANLKIDLSSVDLSNSMDLISFMTKEGIEPENLRDYLENGESLAKLIFLVEPVDKPANATVGLHAVTSVTVSSQKVTGLMLRNIPIQSLAEQALDQMGAEDRDRWMKPVEVTEQQRRLWPKHKKEAAPIIAEVMLNAVTRNKPVNAEVADKFGVSESTAKRMISYARKNVSKVPGIRPLDLGELSDYGTAQTKDRRNRED